MLSEAPDVDDFINADNAREEVNSYDSYLGVEVSLPNAADEKLMAKVKRKVRSADANDEGN